MIAVQAYYDGNSIKPLEEITFKQNQRIILTVMDEFVDVEKPRKKILFDVFSGGMTYIADDFDETPDCFKEYV